jgi:dephospho-CoA kinase
MRLLCITGRKGSGKSVVMKVGAAMGIRSIEMHEPVYERMQEEGIGLTHENIIRYAEGLRKGGDFAIVAKMVLAKIAKERMNDGVLIICGVRHPDEVAEFRKRFASLLVAVDADAKTRFKRITARSEKWDSRTFADFKRKEESESAGLGMGKAVSSADITIRNDGEIGDLEQRARNLLLFIKGG